jgi:hypothetical protein
MAWYKIYLIAAIIITMITVVVLFYSNYSSLREAQTVSQGTGGNLDNPSSLVAEAFLTSLPDAAEVPFGLLLLGGYLLPVFIADKRNHRDRLLVLGINIVFGWTLIGYIGALIWAMTPNRGIKAIAGEFVEKSAPVLKEAAEHNITRGVLRSVHKASGGRFYNYQVPPEGIEHLVFDATATRDYEGRLNIRANTMLPPSTKLTLQLLYSASQEQVYYAEKEVDSDGSVSASGLLNAGKIFDAGDYVLEVTSLPIEPGIQKDWVVDVLGEHGKKLPLSATVPVDDEFPNYGRHVDERLIVRFPAVQQHMRALEFLKGYTFGDEAKSRTVEKVIRDHFSARLDEKPVTPTPWSCEQTGAEIWMVSFEFKRQDRLNIARWEVDVQKGLVKYQDPDARALSGIERRS